MLAITTSAQSHRGRGGVAISWAQPPLSLPNPRISPWSPDHGNGGPGLSPGELVILVTQRAVTPVTFCYILMIVICPSIKSWLKTKYGCVKIKR